jgi:putative FmdB family regulatory protein
MPRYRYRCAACKTEQIIFHRIGKKIDTCPKCNTKKQMSKMLTTPTIISNVENAESTAVGEITKKHIEENREILKQQQKEAKEIDYEPS